MITTALIALWASQQIVDPRAEKLIARVEAQTSATQSLEAICVSRIERLKPKPSVLELTYHVRLMRPGFSLVVADLASRKGGDAAWTKSPAFMTLACDGLTTWSVYASDHRYSSGPTNPDLYGYPVKMIQPLQGFFNRTWLSSDIDFARSEGVLVGLHLLQSTKGSSIVRFQFREPQTEVIRTEDYTVGPDLLIHKIETSESDGSKRGSSKLLNLKVDPAWRPESFAFQPPAGFSSGSGPEAEVKPRFAEGALAPDLVAFTPSNSKLSLSQLRGSPIILDFWATWCGNCIQEFPGIDAIAARHPGLRVLAVNVGDSESVFRKWISEHKRFGHLTFAIEPDDFRGAGAYSKLYKTGLPSELVIDSQGRVVTCLSGNTPQTLRQIEDAVQKTIK